MFTKFFFSWNWKLFQFQCLFLWNYYTFLFWCTYKKKKKTEKNFVSNYHHQISSWKYIIKKGLLAFFEEYIYIYFINNWLWNKNSSEDLFIPFDLNTLDTISHLLLNSCFYVFFSVFYHTFSFFSWFSLSHIIKAFYFHLDYRLTLDLYLFKKKCFET